MRILFVCGVSGGGAPRSTVELADHLTDRGHEVTIIIGERSLATPLYQLGVRAAVKATKTPLAPVITAVLRRMGRAVRPQSVGGSEVMFAPIAVNAARSWLQTHHTDVIVANSLPRIEMRWALQDARGHGTPLIAYLRETHAVTHLTMSGLRPDAVVANARSLADALGGVVRCDVIPSVIDLSKASTTSSREAVLFVNPAPENRPEFFLQMADECPDRRFVIQESWELQPDEWDALVEACNARENVELRRRTERPAEVYRDARVLMATYVSGRPRVIAEAHHNGLPVLAFDHPSLVEAVGGGGVIVPASCTPADAVEALRRMWDGPAYDELCAAALAHAQRDEIDPERLVDRFERILEEVHHGA